MDLRDRITQHPTGTEDMLGWWDANGVEGGCGVQYRTAYDTNNAYLLESADKHPDRIVPVVMLDASEAHTPDRLRGMVMEHGVAGLRLAGVRDRDGAFPWLDSPAALNTWAAAHELGISVVLMLQGGGTSEAAMAALLRISPLAEQFPNVRITVDHVGWPAARGGPDQD